MIHQRHWTFADALEVMSDNTFNQVFDLVVEGHLTLDSDALDKLAERAYPAQPGEEPL